MALSRCPSTISAAFKPLEQVSISLKSLTALRALCTWWIFCDLPGQGYFRCCDKIQAFRPSAEPWEVLFWIISALIVLFSGDVVLCKIRGVLPGERVILHHVDLSLDFGYHVETRQEQIVRTALVVSELAAYIARKSWKEYVYICFKIALVGLEFDEERSRLLENRPSSLELPSR